MAPEYLSELVMFSHEYSTRVTRQSFDKELKDFSSKNFLCRWSEWIECTAKKHLINWILWYI